MAEPVNMEVIRGSKKEPCVYCGKDPHAVPLACPRILAIDIDPEQGCVVGITFRDTPDEGPIAA